MGGLAKIQAALGEFGLFQKRTYALIVIPSLFCAMSTLSQVFLAAVPDHRCYIPGCDDQIAPKFLEPWVSKAIPLLDPDKKIDDPANWNRCKMYQRNNVSGDPGSSVGSEVCDLSFDQSIVISCDRWVFDPSEFPSTIVTEFGLVCEERGWLIPFSQSIFFVGIFVGSLIFGGLSDFFGRKPALGIAIFGMGAIGSLVATSTNVVMYSVLRFFTALCNQGVFMISFVLGIELVGPSKRTMCGILIEYVFAAGEILLVGLALAFPDWRSLQVIIAAPVLLCLLYFRWIPESVDWLISKGKYEKAVDIIEWAERVNGVTVPADAKSELVPQAGGHGDNVAEPSGISAFKHLFASKALVIRALIVFYLWGVVNFVYYGLSLNPSLLGGKLYLNFLLAAVAEFPGYTLAWVLMEYWGRKPAVSFSLALGGLSVIANGILEKYGYMWLDTTLFMIGKVGGTAAFGIIYVYTAELFPTPVRAATIGVASMFSRLGAISAPFVSLLAAYWNALPFFIFGALCMLGAGLSLLLAETRGASLPQTIQDAEDMGKSKTHHRRTQLYPKTDEEEPLLE